MAAPLSGEANTSHSRNKNPRKHPYCGVASLRTVRFNAFSMIRLLATFAAGLLLAGCSSVKKEPPRQPPIARVNVLPLQLSDDFSFRKVSQFFYDARDPSAQRPTQNQMINFERQRTVFGAVSNYDRSERYGHYFNAWWRAKRPANITVRLEYRQENLGSHVMARELHYPNAKGTIESKFNIIGDEYSEDGKVTAWRLILIENGRIVGLRQSFLWN
jgi:hypothetical protein